MGNVVINNKNTIIGITYLPLKQIIDDRGGVFHFLNKNSKTFKNFGEAYFSKINSGVIKGWKLHKKIYQNFCVPFGEVKIVVYDNRKGSPTQGIINEFFLNDTNNYGLLSMPPNLWYSFKSTSKSHSLLANIIDQPHSPSEAINLSLVNTDIPYEW